MARGKYRGIPKRKVSTKVAVKLPTRNEEEELEKARQMFAELVQKKRDADFVDSEESGCTSEEEFTDENSGPEDLTPVLRSKRQLNEDDTDGPQTPPPSLNSDSENEELYSNQTMASSDRDKGRYSFGKRTGRKYLKRNLKSFVPKSNTSANAPPPSYESCVGQEGPNGPLAMLCPRNTGPAERIKDAPHFRPLPEIVNTKEKLVEKLNKENESVDFLNSRWGRKKIREESEKIAKALAEEPIAGPSSGHATKILNNSAISREVEMIYSKRGKNGKRMPSIETCKEMEYRLQIQQTLLTNLTSDEIQRLQRLSDHLLEMRTPIYLTLRSNPIIFRLADHLFTYTSGISIQFAVYLANLVLIWMMSQPILVLQLARILCQCDDSEECHFDTIPCSHLIRGIARSPKRKHEKDEEN